jgi:hypothetical protein
MRDFFLRFLRDSLRRPWLIPFHLVGFCAIGCTLLGGLLEVGGEALTIWVDHWLGEEW